MNELDQNRPDDFWRKAFDEASETPPPRVWNAIERRLDESDGPKILPLWGLGLASSRAFTWGAGLAAAVTLLLVGWWVIHSQPENQSVARVHQTSPTETVAPANPIYSEKVAVIPTTKQPTEAVVVSSKPNRVQARPTRLGSEPVFAGKVPRASALATVDQKIDQQKSATDKPMLTTLAPLLTNSASIAQPTSSVSRVAMVSFSTNQPQGDYPVNSQSRLNAPISFERLAGKPLRLREPLVIQRIVWFRPAETSVEPEMPNVKHDQKEKWASLSVMPGSFNPMVSLQSAQAIQTTGFAASVKSSVANQPQVNSRADFSVAYQASAGIQLSEHWAVESGVGYLAGRSTIETPVQSALASMLPTGISQTSVASNLYVDALRNSISPKSTASLQAAADYLAANNYNQVTNSYDSRVQQTLSNDYQYMQVPVQVSYQLRPRKRLGLALLGGFLTNIFVRNTVGDAVVVTGKDGVYQPVSLAATMGARLRYRPSRQWSASLAGIYQPSLGAGTQSGSQVQTRPTSAGMSFGVDYHF
ncbi:hypothetical protein [Spirosoma areae]